ncbi:MAG: isochorismatase [Bryobacterales bacterium]
MTQQLDWKARETAIIVCDMWDDLLPLGSAAALGDDSARMDGASRRRVKLGVHVIHAPSGTMDFYADYPQRKKMQAVPYAKPPVEISKWCYLDPKDEAALPIKDDEEPCDDAVVTTHPDVQPRASRYSDRGISLISDDGQEIYNYFTQQGVANVMLMGVHANMCVLGRPFGIRQQVRLGKKVALVRDLTDAMYDPRDRLRLA